MNRKTIITDNDVYNLILNVLFSQILIIFGIDFDPIKFIDMKKREEGDEIYYFSMNRKKLLFHFRDAQKLDEESDDFEREIELELSKENDLLLKFIDQKYICFDIDYETYFIDVDKAKTKFKENKKIKDEMTSMININESKRKMSSIK